MTNEKIERTVKRTYELVKELNQKVDYLIATRREYYLRGELEYYVEE